MKARGGLITPAGSAGIAVVKVLGDDCRDIVKRIFRPSHGDIFDSDLQLGQIIDPDSGEIIDQVIIDAELNRSPGSYEINCHGGPRIVQRLLMLLRRLGVEIVPWRQLSPSRSIVEEIERVLPEAKTPLAVRAIAGQYPLGLTAWLDETIASLQAKPQSWPTIQKFIIEHLLASYGLVKKLLAGFNVVLTGPANVGKSTLANALTGKAQSIVSDLPGTTRDWTCQFISMESVGVNIVDTAGRRQSDDEIEYQSLLHAETVIGRADLLLLVFDNSADKMTIERYLADLPTDTPKIIVLNKSDLGRPAGLDIDYIAISALGHNNLDLLQKNIVSRLGLADFDPAEPIVFTAEQYGWLKRIAVEPVGADEALAVLLDWKSSCR